MNSRILTAIGVAVLLSTLALQDAQAQAKPVTRDQLRVCMDTESSFAPRRQALDARGAKNREEAAAIRAEREEMSAEAKRLEETGASMDRFNRRVRTHNERVKTAQDEAGVFRTDLEALNKAMIAYNEQCGGITYMPEDKAAILKEREAAKK
ncbi:MAG: hypothetical protein ABIR26_17730 [Ramlibacter sp.]